MTSVALPAGPIHLGLDTSKDAILVGILRPDEVSPDAEKIFNEKVPYLVSTSCEYKHPTPLPFATSRSIANWKEGVLAVARVTNFTDAARFMGLPARGEPSSTDPAALATFIRQTFYPTVLTTDESFVREQGLLPPR